jgi:UDP-GlcNAc:undecaprenyl-phosphate GlcNAc-1-phosphate transferase
VTVIRKLSGRGVAQGGRDHVSHRLVALGLSERRAVWMLYGFAGVSGLIAQLVRELRGDVSLVVIIGFAVLLALVGVYLAGVKVYDESEVAAARSKPLVSFLVDLSYKRRIFEVLLDVVLIVLSYYTAYLLLFGEMNAEAWVLFLRAAPVLVAIKLAAFLGAGVYRGLWRYISIDNVLVYAKAVAAGTVASVLVLLFAFRFEGFSRGVFVLDAMLLFMMLTGSRTAFRLFRRLIPAPTSGEGCRVLIYGAGDAGELLVREMINNKELRYTPVGFLDDDPHKKGRVIHGLRVFGGNGSLRAICREQRVMEVLISSSKVSEDRVREIRTDCEADGVTLKRMRIHFEQLSDD